MNDLATKNEIINLDISLIPLVHDYLSGISLDDCALKYSLDSAQVSEFLNRREVKSYISNRLKNTGYVGKQRRIELLSRIVEEKLEFAAENELPSSNKDLLEVLKLLREEENDLHKQNGEVVEENGKAAYVQIINTLRAD